MSRRKKIKKANPSGGLGVRYGVRARRKYSELLFEMRQKHSCPQCSSNSVKRESVGIWICKRCDRKFTGGAYIPLTKIGMTAIRSTRSS